MAVSELVDEVRGSFMESKLFLFRFRFWLCNRFRLQVWIRIQTTFSSFSNKNFVLVMAFLSLEATLLSRKLSHFWIFRFFWLLPFYIFYVGSGSKSGNGCGMHSGSAKAKKFRFLQFVFWSHTTTLGKGKWENRRGWQSFILNIFSTHGPVSTLASWTRFHFLKNLFYDRCSYRCSCICVTGVRVWEWEKRMGDK